MHNKLLTTNGDKSIDTQIIPAEGPFSLQPEDWCRYRGIFSVKVVIIIGRGSMQQLTKAFNNEELKLQFLSQVRRLSIKGLLFLLLIAIFP